MHYSTTVHFTAGVLGAFSVIGGLFIFCLPLIAYGSALGVLCALTNDSL
jgi:hypothetical protein